MATPTITLTAAGAAYSYNICLPAFVLTTARSAGAIELCRDQPDGLQRETIHVYDLWLPAAFHAAGVCFIQMTRPFAAYRGPAWLVGYRSYPICGVFGLAVLALLVGWAALVT